MCSPLADDDLCDHRAAALAVLSFPAIDVELVLMATFLPVAVEVIAKSRPSVLDALLEDPWNGLKKGKLLVPTQ